jgi:cation transport regulator
MQDLDRDASTARGLIGTEHDAQRSSYRAISRTNERARIAARFGSRADRAGRQRSTLRRGDGTAPAGVDRMPYATNASLPAALRKYLPHHAQDIYRAAFNSAFDRYGPTHEAIAHRIAWAAVKQRYAQRAAGVWERRLFHA